MPVKLMSLEEASAFLNMEGKELKALVTSGELPCIYQGTRMLFDHDELDNWYTNRLVNHLPIRHATSDRSRNELSLADYCRLETMTTTLSGKTKPAVLRSLTQLAEEAGLLYDPAEFLEELRRREENGSTAMAEGVAIVHPQTRDEYICQKPFVAVAKSHVPVFFGEANGVPTDLFFLVCSADPDEHLRLIAEVARKILDPKFLAALRAAESPQELLQTLCG